MNKAIILLHCAEKNNLLKRLCTEKSHAGHQREVNRTAKDKLQKKKKKKTLYISTQVSVSTATKYLLKQF